MRPSSRDGLSLRGILAEFVHLRDGLLGEGVLVCDQLAIKVGLVLTQELIQGLRLVGELEVIDQTEQVDALAAQHPAQHLVTVHAPSRPWATWPPAHR